MPYWLADRATNVTERMDDPDCSRADLFNTYRQFSTINAMISGWKKIYRKQLRPLFKHNSARTCTLLDIGFGGGDIPLKIARWAARDDISLEITAIETDPRAMEFIQTVEYPDNITFKKISAGKLADEGQKFDVVISNHLLHHLLDEERSTLLKQAANLSRQKVIFNDIERSDMAYALFNVFARPVFRSSFITDDGLTSIKRSYTAPELRAKVPHNWNVYRLFPFRLLLTYDANN